VYLLIILVDEWVLRSEELSAVAAEEGRAFVQVGLYSLKQSVEARKRLALDLSSNEKCGRIFYLKRSYTVYIVLRLTQ
jgi:hypothetical protein